MIKNMDSKTEQKRLLDLIESRLKEIIPNMNPQEVYEPFRYIMAEGGKRIRPMLAVLTCGCICGVPEKAIDAACSIETMHNFTLVHDDIMDNSSIRRGKETVHKKWDESVGILTGDTMVGYSYRFLETYSNETSYREMIKALTTALIEVAEGQTYDMQFNTNKNVELKDYFLMIGKKTSALLQGSVLLGGNCAGASKEELTNLDEYAYNLGIAFQIQDDLLDITANQAKFGKQIGQDLIEGKKSYLILKARELAEDKNDIQLIEKFFNDNGLQKEEIQKMKSIYEKLNIFEIAQNEIEKYLEVATQSINKLKKNEYTEILLDLLKSLNKRNY